MRCMTINTRRIISGALATLLALGLVQCGPDENDGRDGSAAAPGVSNRSSFEDFQWRWEYAPERVDLTYEAIFGSRKSFTAWAAQTQAYFQGKLDQVAIPDVRFGQGEVRRRGEASITAFESAQGDALLAVPGFIDSRRPLIVAIHGHESDHRGDLPWRLFDSWAGRFVEDGYAVWAPSHLWYDRVSGQRHPDGARVAEWDSSWHEAIGVVDYPIEWTARISALLDAARAEFPPHDGLAVVGLSSGGLTGAFLMAARTDIEAGVFAGSFQVLDFLREHYRIKDHPSNWDVSWLNSYSALFALIAPRPAQWQLGRQDTFWPGTAPGEPAASRFPGLARRQMGDEIWGQFLLLERVWSKFDSAPSFHVHDEGHEVDYLAARSFIEAHTGR